MLYATIVRKFPQKIRLRVKLSLPFFLVKKKSVLDIKDRFVNRFIPHCAVQILFVIGTDR